MAMLRMTRGQKVKLGELSPSSQLRVTLGAHAPGLTLDFSCFGVDAQSKLSDDRYFVFYNQTASPENAIRISNARPNVSTTFDIDLRRLPESVRKLVFVLTLDGTATLAQLGNGSATLAAGGTQIAHFAFSGHDFGQERAIIALELYLKDEWRVSAVGQGFAGGLSALLKHFGGEEDVSAAPPAPPVKTPQPRFVPQPATTPRGAATPPSNPNACARCGKDLGFLQQLGGAKRAPRRCSKCDGDVKRVLGGFRQAFLRLTANATLSQADWKTLRTELTRERVPWDEGLAFVRGDAMQLLERNLAMAAADGIIEPHEEQEFNALQIALAIPPHLAAPLDERMKFLKELTLIRQGHLPRVTASIHLDSEEICHLEVGVNFHKVGARAVTLVPGRLVVTNKKLHFLSATGGWTMQYKNVMRVEGGSNHIYIELATRQGNGRYDVADAARAEAIIDAATRLNKRKLMLPHEGRDTRSVPHHVQIAVWQRDGGKCVQCSAASYLEYDHIIPRSRGGATSENNLQLLCRRCNGEKGNKI